MALTDVSDQTFQKDVIDSAEPVIVDFWAPWCGPCRMAAPVLEELSETYNSQIKIVKLNVDENQEAAERFGVMSIPTTILFKNGIEAGRQIGFAGKQAFEDLIKRGITSS